MDLSAILNVLLAAGLAAVGALWRRTSDEKQRLETRLHEAKREQYEAYMDILREVYQGTRAGKASASTSRNLERLSLFAFRSPLLASDNVLRAHIRFMNLDRIAPDDSSVALPAVADVIVALRRDMGFTNTTTKAREVMGSLRSQGRAPRSDRRLRARGWPCSSRCEARR